MTGPWACGGRPHAGHLFKMGANENNDHFFEIMFVCGDVDISGGHVSPEIDLGIFQSLVRDWFLIR